MTTKIIIYSEVTYNLTLYLKSENNLLNKIKKLVLLIFYKIDAFFSLKGVFFSFLFYKNQGFRVIVIDSFGMGFSDKAKHFSHNYALDLIEFESRYLLELFNFLNLSTIHMVASNWSLIIAIQI